MMTLTREEIVKTIRSFHANIAACDQAVLKLVRTIGQLEQSRADAEKIMTATFRPTWQAGKEDVQHSVLRDVSDIYVASLESSDREIRDLYAAVAEQTRRKEKMCWIWTRFMELPEKEARILSIMYEDRPEKETYAEKMARAEEMTGFSESHIARLARSGIRRILDASRNESG